MPSTAQPSCGRASARMPATLRPSTQHVVRPLDRRLRRRPRRRRRPPRRAGAAAGARAGRATSAAPPRRRRPSAALAPAAGGLLAGGHERAVRRARGGERLRARSFVESVARRCRRGRPRALTRRAPAMRTSSSRRRPELVGGRAAVDGDRERSGRRPRRGAARPAATSANAARSARRRRSSGPRGRARRPVPAELVVRDVERDVAEAVERERVGDERDAVLGARSGSSSATSWSTGERLAGRARAARRRRGARRRGRTRRGRGTWR